MLDNWDESLPISQGRVPLPERDMMPSVDIRHFSGNCPEVEASSYLTLRSWERYLARYVPGVGVWYWLLVAKLADSRGGLSFRVCVAFSGREGVSHGRLCRTRNSGSRDTQGGEVTPGMFVMHENSRQESLSTVVGGVAAPPRKAKGGDYWAKFHRWATYQKGADGVERNAEEARKLLVELVEGAYLATFQPVSGFAPKTPGEFIAEFDKHSSLGSEPTGLGGASFFRTKAEDGRLIGSFLTAYPDKMREAIDGNPSLELISIERATPEMFIRYEASPQESLR